MTAHQPRKIANGFKRKEVAWKTKNSISAKATFSHPFKKLRICVLKSLTGGDFKFMAIPTLISEAYKDFIGLDDTAIDAINDCLGRINCISIRLLFETFSFGDSSRDSDTAIPGAGITVYI